MAAAATPAPLASRPANNPPDNFLLAAFRFCQCWFKAFATLVSHDRSLARKSKWVSPIIFA
jgi:hypothetical protein